jgi:hypothetical protein
MTSNSKAEGRLRQARLPLGAEEDIYIPAGERLAYLYTNRGKWISPAPLRRRGADGSQNAPGRPWPHGVYKDAVDYSVFSGGWDAVETRGDPKDFAARWAAYVALYDPNVVIHEAPSLPYGGYYSRYRGTFGGGHPQTFNPEDTDSPRGASGKQGPANCASRAPLVRPSLPARLRRSCWKGPLFGGAGSEAVACPHERYRRPRDMA